MEAGKFMKRHKLREGQEIRLKAKDAEYEGTILPQSEKTGNIRLKLKSGYNIGIKADAGTKVEKASQKKEAATHAKAASINGMKVSHDPSLPKISLLHTGGTIASRVDYRTGGVYVGFSPEDLFAMFPELAKIGNFSSKLVAKMWSDDLRFRHFEVIAKAVKKEHESGANGIIIGMGTDNLAVAASALAFAIEECPIPVLLVGAQRSSDRPSSDAAMNLICAAEFIAKTDFAGVAICMHNSSSDDKCAILPPCKAKKLHTSRRDTFKAVNDTPIAFVDYYASRQVEFLKQEYGRKSHRPMKIMPMFEEKVGIMKAHMNLFPEQIEVYRKNRYKGLVIEGTGLGHMPGHNPNEYTKIHEKFFPELRKLISTGCVAVMTSNTVFGRVHMHVYEKAIDLANIGIVSGEDMLPETALVKLSWLLGNYKPKEAKELIGKNLRGEIKEFTKYKGGI
ncbi:Glutamyl-tRNA(Gln) amidotransferase subunit D [uncultured archaeon]|nr:Glutamyl-tRNA(Gln) amidotransferase subunit D [uncultured archaeon]